MRSLLLYPFPWFLTYSAFVFIRMQDKEWKMACVILFALY